MRAKRLTDSELLTEAVAEANGEAFAELYRRHIDPVLAYLHRRTGSPELALDLAAETFATAIASAHTFRGDGEVAGWLYGIARNKLLESLRRGRVEDAARRVAGSGAKGGPLPGVAPVPKTVPTVDRAPINVTLRGHERAVEVRFRSPVPLDARPGVYSVSVRGPQTRRASCSKPTSSQAEWGREIAAGERILIRVRPANGAPGRRLPAWCPGARYDVRVRHVVRDSYKPGLLSEQLVGTTSFVAD